MRVCYLNPAGGALFDHAYVAHQPYGGAEVALTEQARVLALDPAFDVHMIVNHHRDGELTRDGIRVHTIGGTYADQPLRPFAAYRRAYWRALGAVDADIYVQRGVPAELYFLAALACRVRRKRYVQALALAPLERLDVFTVRNYVRFILLERASLRLASAVVALARDQLDTLPPAVRRKAHVIPEGKRLQAVTDRARTYVLWTGRSHAIKRPELFLALARALPHERFVMAISGKLDESDVPANVSVHHNVPHASMDELYAGAKVLVHTSLNEGFANVFIEAWKNGTPVVSLGVDTDGLIASQGLGRHARSPADLVRAVTELLGDEAAWRACSRRARAYAQQHHDIFRQMERYKELFRDLMSSSAGRPVAPTATASASATPEAGS